MTARNDVSIGACLGEKRIETLHSKSSRLLRETTGNHPNLQVGKSTRSHARTTFLRSVSVTGKSRKAGGDSLLENKIGVRGLFPVGKGAEGGKLIFKSG